MNTLYFFDCLDVLKKLNQQHPEGFIDLIYIDPPFNSKRDYNVLFESLDLTDTKAQKQAFSDTWSSVSYLDSLNEIQDLDLNLYNFLKTLDSINISQSAVSYLTTMAIRNPFNPTTIIEYGVGSRENGVGSKEYVVLKIYDVLGKEIETLVNEQKSAGRYSVEFDATKYPAGIYYYEVRAGEYRSIKKMLYIK